MANPSTTPSATATDPSRRYFERVAQANRDLLDSSAKFSSDVLTAWTDMARSTQAAALSLLLPSER